MFAKPKVKLRMRRKAWRQINISYPHRSALAIHKILVRIKKKNTSHIFTK